MPSSAAKLGVNIDHFATLRQLRRTSYPDICSVAKQVEAAGAHQITVHLREDRRHIQSEDVLALKRQLSIPLNLEMAVADTIVRFACRVRPAWACLVPEKRQELTTEGGLHLTRGKSRISKAIKALQKKGIRVSLFIEPSLSAVETSRELGADAVEFHTGRFCLATQNARKAVAAKELERIHQASRLGASLGLKLHAGHGIDYENIRSLVRAAHQVPPIEEFNIGHSIVCRAAEVGIECAVREMISLIQAP